MINAAAKPRLRPISAQDKQEVSELLCEGFPRRSLTYWQTAMDRLSHMIRPEGFQHAGFAIEDNGKVVGVILVLSVKPAKGNSGTRANLSSWYVRPQYRSLATMLLARACKEQQVTFLNVSAAPHTHAICEALGFRRYSEGQFVAVPILTARSRNLSVEEFSGADFDDNTDRMMSDHMSYGCICLTGKGKETTQPFIFVTRKIRGFIPAAQLVYCTSTEHFAEFSAAIGAYFAKRGILVVLLDSSGPIKGLRGKYIAGKTPKYFKGPDAPRQNDLAYTEIAMFGI